MNTLLTSLLFFGCVFLGAQYAQAKIIHVNSAAGVGGNGTSWLTACRFLQDALAVTEEGDEVWVAAGTYYPDDGTSITKGDRTSSFTLKQDVKLIGGFAGGEIDQDQRNPDENISILSGEIWTDKIYWSLHVVTFAGSATLDGFTVMKGNANGETTPHNQGAAIYAPNTTTPVIANCRFLNNTASSYGGAIFSASTSSFIGVSVTKCIFSNNTASSGGAIYANSIYSYSYVSASYCTFSDNSALSEFGSGGAIYSNQPPITVTNSTFTRNVASGSSGSGGAISGSTSVSNCTFTSNSASSGGAVSGWTRATDCNFSNNNASSGGAIYSSSSLKVTATNCVFSSNTASSFISSRGGAIYGSTTALNSTFSNNIASSGGAIYGPATSATKCVFSNNSATLSSGGAISGASIVTNCEFFDNIAFSSGGAIYGSGSTTTATDSTFSSNSAPSGGAIFSVVTNATNCSFSENFASSDGGAISSSTTAVNCIFSKNSAVSFGGAIYSPSTSFSYPVSLINCTLIDNSVQSVAQKGGAVHAKGLVKIFNNIFWNALAQPQNNQIYITATGSIRNADVSFPSPLNQAKNLIKGGVASITVEVGAIVSIGDTSVTLVTSDPLFVDTTNPSGADGIWKTFDDGLRLKPTSPARDLGLSLFLPVDTYDLDKDGNLTELIPVDFANDNRILGESLDLGAYEAREITALTTYQEWVSFHNLTGNNSFESANPSGDGVSNLMKYALGLNPNEYSLAVTDGVEFGLPLLEMAGGAMKFTFIRDTAKLDISYSIEFSEDILTWRPVTAGVVETALQGTLIRVDLTIPAGAQLFCRLKVSK